LQGLVDYYPPASSVKSTVSEPTVPKDKGTEVPSAKATKGATGLGSSGELEYVYEVSSHPFRNLFFGLILLGVPVSLFVWCGGIRLLRRVIKGKGKERSRYRKVGDEDVEK